MYPCKEPHGSQLPGFGFGLPSCVASSIDMWFHVLLLARFAPGMATEFPLQSGGIQSTARPSRSGPHACARTGTQTALPCGQDDMAEWLPGKPLSAASQQQQQAPLLILFSPYYSPSTRYAGQDDLGSSTGVPHSAHVSVRRFIKLWLQAPAGPAGGLLRSSSGISNPSKPSFLSLFLTVSSFLPGLRRARLRYKKSSSYGTQNNSKGCRHDGHGPHPRWKTVLLPFWVKIQHKD